MTTIPYPGGKERESSLTNVEMDREEARRELLEICKQIGRDAQQFFNTLSPRAFLERPKIEVHSNIIQRALYYLIVDLSENEKENGDSKIIALEDFEQKAKSLFMDSDFLRGFSSLQNFIVDALARRSFHISHSGSEISVGARTFKKDEFENYLIEDIRGWMLVAWAKEKIEAEFSAEREAGRKSRKGVWTAATLYMLALAQYTYPHLDRINELGRRI